MSRSAAQTFEQQNDDQLTKLFDKVKALRGVTNDIHSDAESQRSGLLADASESFDAFGSRLSQTSSRFTRDLVNGSKGSRTMLYMVGGAVLLFLVWHFFL